MPQDKGNKSRECSSIQKLKYMIFGRPPAPTAIRHLVDEIVSVPPNLRQI